MADNYGHNSHNLFEKCTTLSELVELGVAKKNAQYDPGQKGKGC